MNEQATTILGTSYTLTPLAGWFLLEVSAIGLFYSSGYRLLRRRLSRDAALVTLVLGSGCALVVLFFEAVRSGTGN